MNHLFKLLLPHQLKSPLRYPGGKSRIAQIIHQHLPRHQEYREIFFGGGGIFFYKSKAKKNWINDLHPGLYAFWKTLRDNYNGFVNLCRKQDTRNLKDIFQGWVVRKDLMTAIGDNNLLERAVQYYFLNRTVWMGRVIYNPSLASRLYFSNPSGWSIEKKIPHLKQCSDKLQGVKITCLPFEQCLDDVDKETLIYVDPPYYRDSLDVATSKLYDYSFSIDDHTRLRDAMKSLKAQIVISYDDCAMIRNLYIGWRIIPLQWTYCGKHVAGKEILILSMRREDA